MPVTLSADELRRQILELVRDVPRGRLRRPRPFVPGETPVPVSGRVFDAAEMQSPGRRVARLLAHHRPLRRASSSARFASVFGRPPRACWSTPARRPTCSPLTRADLAQARRARGSSPATRSSPSPPASRPRSTRSSRTAWSRSSSTSTVPTYNVDVDAARGRARPADPGHHAGAHAGQPVRPRPRCAAFAEEHDLWLVEDCCDAVGSTYGGQPRRHLRRPRDASASTPPTTSRWARAAAC